MEENELKKEMKVYLRHAVSEHPEIHEIFGKLESAQPKIVLKSHDSSLGGGLPEYDGEALPEIFDLPPMGMSDCSTPTPDSVESPSFLAFTPAWNLPESISTFGNPTFESPRMNSLV